MTAPARIDIGKIRRPKDTNFQQQRFKVWRSFVNVKMIIPLLCYFGTAFMAIAVVMAWTDDDQYEQRKEYTSCNRTENQTDNICRVEIRITRTLKPPIYFYYILTNYHQNFRLYSSSIDYNQFMGNPSLTPSEKCSPLQYNTSQIPYLPCGLLPNSLFNDTFKINKTNSTEVPWSYSGLVLPHELDFFKNPANWSSYINSNNKPPNWIKTIDQIGDKNSTSIGVENIDLINWIRVSPFPDAIKLYRMISTELNASTYTIEIENNYHISGQNIKKFFMIATVGHLGLRSDFLAYANLITGLVCIIISFLLLMHNFYSAVRSRLR